MTWLYVAEVGVIGVAFVGMLRLKRAGDRAWRIHQIRQRRLVIVRLVADTSGFEAAMREAGSAVERLRGELGRSRGPLERVGRDLDDMVRRIRKAMRESIPELRDDEKGCE